MIRFRRDCTIRCDKCFEGLEYPDDTALTSHVGHPIFEDTPEVIRIVAVDMGWGVNPDVCKKCNNKSPDINTLESNK